MPHLRALPPGPTIVSALVRRQEEISLPRLGVEALLNHTVRCRVACDSFGIDWKRRKEETLGRQRHVELE